MASSFSTHARTHEFRANTGEERLERIEHTPTRESVLLDEIASYWQQFIRAETPNVVEILTITAAASHLLNIPDPEGPEIKAYAAYWGKVKQINKGPGSRGEKDAAIMALGDEPQVPTDPRLKEIKDPLGLFHFPVIGINAPVMGCGKSKAAEALKHLSRRTKMVLGATYATVRDRKAAGYGMVVDEAQRTFEITGENRNNWEMLLNSSFDVTAGGPDKMVPISSNGAVEPKEFPQFGMLVLAGISLKLPGDNTSRMIWANLRKVEGGEVGQWKSREHPQVFARFGERLSEAFSPLMAEAYHHDKPMPPEVTGRLGDKWAPLIITADLAGGRWPDMIRRIAVNAIRIEQGNQPEQVDKTEKAYADVREVWPEGVDRLSNQQIIDYLRIHDPESYGYLKPTEQGGGHQLRSLLSSSEFPVPKSKTSSGWRGRYFEDFRDAWNHYERLREASVLCVPSVLPPDSRGSDVFSHVSSAEADVFSGRLCEMPNCGKPAPHFENTIYYCESHYRDVYGPDNTFQGGGARGSLD